MSFVSREAAEKCESAILICGAARSGTTLAGRLIHSCARVEYAFEPPTLFALFSHVQSIDPSTWRLLFQTYVYEEFLAGALAGRTINTNPYDQSSFISARTEEELAGRLGRSWGRADLEEHLGDAVVALKVPDILPYIKPARDALGGGLRPLVVVREPAGVLTSLLERAWFSDEALETGNLVWLRRASSYGVAPFWLARDDEELWHESNELMRCAIYYAAQYESMPQRGECVAVSYDHLTADARPTLEWVVERLDLEPGPRTWSLTDSVRAARRVDREAILCQLPSGLRERLEQAYANAASRCGHILPPR